MLKKCDITVDLSQRYQEDITVRNTENGIDTCLRASVVAVSDQIRLFRIQK